MRRFLNSRLILIFILTLSFGLRLYKLADVPISLHGDEVGVGYNAFSLLTAGIDEYGERWPMRLRGDISPMIFYATIPSIALFGVTDFAIRFPSVVVGVSSVLTIYFLTYELFNRNKKIALLTAFLMAISPWHIQISRIGHDAPYGLLLQIVGLWLFLRAIRLNFYRLIYISSICFGLSFYAYHSPPLTTSLILIGLIFFFRYELRNIKRIVILSGIIFVLIITPRILHLVNKPLAETRFGGINIFIRQPGDSLAAFPLKLTGNYLQQFFPTPLFFDSSTTRYFNVQNVGLFYAIELPLLLAGVFYVLKYFKRKWLLFYLLAISVYPGALTLGPVSGGRVLLLLPVLLWFCALGLSFLNKAARLFFVGVYAVLVVVFMHQYFVDSGLRFYNHWGYGAKQIAQFVTEHESEADSIIITDEIKQMYVYVLFYGKKDPLWLKNALQKQRHWYIGYTAFDKYQFQTIEEKEFLPGTMVVGSFDQFKTRKPEKIILGPDQKPLFAIFRF